MQRHLRILATASAICIGLAVWLAWPERSQWGNPRMETQLATCRMANGVVARLYEGNGGATTSFWYSVTLEGGRRRPERQVLFVYGHPTLELIECRAGELRVKTDGPDIAILEQDFAHLRKHPRSIWRGDERASVSR